jgi:hypothetical protein
VTLVTERKRRRLNHLALMGGQKRSSHQQGADVRVESPQVEKTNHEGKDQRNIFLLFERYQSTFRCVQKFIR